MTGTNHFRSIIAAVALTACSSAAPPGPPEMLPDAAEATCGDGVCSAGETLASCAADCSRCGDNQCTGNETVQSCPGDCGYCGDKVCASNESIDSCPQDCGANLELQNDTTYTITAFYFQPCGGSWTSNELSPYTIAADSTFQFTGIPPGCYYWEATAGTEYWETPSGITLTAGEMFTWNMY
jgi:hypothetical protein